MDLQLQGNQSQIWLTEFATSIAPSQMYNAPSWADGATKQNLTCNSVVFLPTVSCIRVCGSEGEQRRCVQVFRHLYAIVEASKDGDVVIQIEHSDPHCRFSIVG